MKSLALAFLLLPSAAFAGPWYELVNGTMSVTGIIGVAASTTSPKSYAFTLDGPHGYIKFPDGTKQYSAGTSGTPGPTGPAGAAATVSVGTTTTGASGSYASVSNVGTSTAAIFNFTIPQGAQGTQGIQGNQGVQGPQGVQGIQGIQGPAGNVDFTSTGTFSGLIDFSQRVNVSSTITAAHFVGDGSALSGKLTYPVTGLVSLGTYGLTTSSDVVAHAYYGDGSHLTGISVGSSTNTIDALPIGTFIQYGSVTPPSSYLYCDGTLYSTTTYSALFSVIGYKYGGSGANFTCDFRGMFSRGLDTTRTIDSQYRVIGSTEADSIVTHTHTVSAVTGLGSRGLSNNAEGLVATTRETVAQTPAGDTETRPKNIAVAMMVKYRTNYDVIYTTNTVGPLVTSSSTYSGQNKFAGVSDFTGSVTVSSFTATNATIANWGWKVIAVKNFVGVSSITFDGLSSSTTYHVVYNIRTDSAGYLSARFNDITDQYYYSGWGVTNSGATATFSSGDGPSIALQYTSANNRANWPISGEFSVSAYATLVGGYHIAQLYSGSSSRYRTDSYHDSSMVTGFRNLIGGPLQKVRIFANTGTISGEAYIMQLTK